MEVQEVLYKMRSTCCREEVESPNSTYLETWLQTNKSRKQTIKQA